MKKIKTTGEAVCSTREELAKKYFGGLVSIYGASNLGIVSLLSDLQEEIAMGNISNREHYREILNDVKCILITDERVKK